jgi:hypothetical protein
MTISVTPTGFDFEDFEDWLWVDDIPVMEEDPEPETEGEMVEIQPDYLPLIKFENVTEDTDYVSHQ